MTNRWETLSNRIEIEVHEIDETVDAIERHWSRVKAVQEDQDAFVNSVALNLQSFYTGIEHILESIALAMDGEIQGGDAWHAQLIKQMQAENTPVRPAVISEETGERLGEYRKFRHRVRNIYAGRLDADLMEPLVENLPAFWKQLRIELLAFSKFLTRLG